MKNNWFTYIHINEKDQYVYSSGVKFQEFINGIKKKPKNLLILDGYPFHSTLDTEFGLDYVMEEQLNNFYQEDVYDFGNFAWMDYKEFNKLKSLSDDELAEILFFRHMWKPLRAYTFDKLQNNYAYFCHDDDYITKIYMKNIENYCDVINHKILTELKGRKKYIANISPDILEYLFDLCKKGIVFDFEKSYATGVTLYVIGEIGNVDEAHEKLDRMRNTLHGISLSYDNRKKEWTITC